MTVTGNERENIYHGPFLLMERKQLFLFSFLLNILENRELIAFIFFVIYTIAFENISKDSIYNYLNIMMTI